jgi:hypothetical protein
MKNLLTWTVALGVIAVLPALAMADHDRSRSRSRVHVSIGVGAGVHYQSGYSRQQFVHHHYLPQREVVVRHQQLHYLPAYSRPQVVIVQPCPPPVIYQYHAPVYYQPPVVYQPAPVYYYQQQTYYYGR